LPSTGGGDRTLTGTKRRGARLAPHAQLVDDSAPGITRKKMKIGWGY
jgi:hypothetical protein